MSETFYRGEAVGVAPARPGAVPDHDLGDGMYLTTSKEAAIAYADLRADTPAARRLYSVQIDLSSLKVLDLRKDARWLRDLKFLEPSIRAANENYGRAFQNFIKANNINLADYDAVIGPDYVRGGTQICILSKGGAPSPAQMTFRNMFRPEALPGEPPAARSPSTGAVAVPKVPAKAPDKAPAKPPPPPPPRAKAATSAPAAPAAQAPRATRPVTPPATPSAPAMSHFRMGVMVVGFGIADLAISLLGGWLRKRTDAKWTEDRLREIEPKIAQGIEEHRGAIASLLSEGKKAYANVTLRIEQHNEVTQYGVIPSFPIVKLLGVFVSAENVNVQQSDADFRFADTVNSVQYTYSVEVTVKEEDVKLFRTQIATFRYYDDRMRADPSNPLFQRELEKARAQMIATFGRAISYDVLDASLWPKFKYAGKPLKE